MVFVWDKALYDFSLYDLFYLNVTAEGIAKQIPCIWDFQASCYISNTSELNLWGHWTFTFYAVFNHLAAWLQVTAAMLLFSHAVCKYSLLTTDVQLLC